MSKLSLYLLLGSHQMSAAKVPECSLYRSRSWPQFSQSLQS